MASSLNNSISPLENSGVVDTPWSAPYPILSETMLARTEETRYVVTASKHSHRAIMVGQDAEKFQGVHYTDRLTNSLADF